MIAFVASVIELLMKVREMKVKVCMGFGVTRYFLI